MQEKDMENKGMRLLKKGKKGILRIVFSRTGFVTILLLINFFVLFAALFKLREFLPHIFGGTAVFTIAMVLYLFNSPLDSSAKMTWMAVIVLLPVFGSMLYLFTIADFGHRAMTKAWEDSNKVAKRSIRQDKMVQEAFLKEDRRAAAMTAYVGGTGRYPVYANTEATYFASGEEKFQAILEALEQAERFIFLEYFIVEEGMMWGRILEILARKASQGVEVRLMYDGTCEFALLPKDYPKRLKDLGIQCRVFAPIAPLVSTHYNYRDHRKILVADGCVAFTGGVNLADEYINHIRLYGHWKDTAVMLRGDAVQSLTLMFLQMWSLKGQDHQWQSYLELPQDTGKRGLGYVMPYGDSPLDGQQVGKQVYMDILNRAERYVHIMTPYLILDDEMKNTLCYTAKRGVEVVLILPGIPDKKIPYALAKTHYRALLAAGVKIYEYTPGFVHAKVFVSDDREAVVGTINLDYRSLYHHFECAAYLYGTSCIGQIEKDMQCTKELCQRVSLETVKKTPLIMKLLGYVCKMFAPLM